MPRRKDGIETQELILTTAAKLFADNGYAKTTNAEIARSCGGINPALISYYFGDKATLYVQAWEHAHTASIRNYPYPNDPEHRIPAFKRLHTIIDLDIRRRSDSNCYDNDIMLNELSSPTGLLGDVHEKSLCSLRSALREVVAEILGEKCPVEVQRLAVLSIFSMCVVPVRKIQSLETDVQYTFDTAKRVEHVYNFALAGLLDILNRRGE